MNKKLTKLLLAVLCLAMLIAAAACAQSAESGKESSGTEQNAAEPTYTFGNITFDNAGEWNQLSVKAFQYAADLAGVETVVIPVINNTEDQINGMQTLISAQVDAISVYTATAELDVRLSEMAGEAGIPISFENGIPGEGAEYISIATHDWRVLGERTAEMHCSLFAGKKALLVLGAPGMSIVEPWLEGYMQVYETNGKPFEIVGTEYTDWGTEKALNVTQDFIQAGGEFDAVFAHNGPMYAGVMSALKDAGLMDKVVKACGGGQDDELEWIKSGELDGTISYLPSAQGIAAFKGLWMHVNGKTPPKEYDLPMVPITKENVDSAVAWDDFEGALELVGGLELE